MSGFLDWLEDCLRSFALAVAWWVGLLIVCMIAGALIGAGFDLEQHEDVVALAVYGLPTLALPWLWYRAYTRVRRARHELASGAAVIE